MGLFGLESSQSSIRFGYTHYRRKRRWLTRPGQFEAQADPNLSAAARTHGDARSTQRRMSSRNTRLARPVRGRPWKADGAHRPSWRPDAVRYMSVDTTTQRSAAIQGDT